MEIFEEKVYDSLSEEYQKAIDESTLGAINRAVSGKIPFTLKKSNDNQNLLRCARLNNELILMLEKIPSYRADSIKKLLELNKKEFPDQTDGEKIDIVRYENPFIKYGLELVLEIEKTIVNPKLISRCYCILSALFSL